MNIAELATGARLLLEDRSTVEVLAPSTDGRSVRVRYLDNPFAPELVGTEADCTNDAIMSQTDEGQTSTAVRMI